MDVSRKLLGRTPTNKGSVVISDEPLGKGGEGSVYNVESHSLDGLPDASMLVAKIYHNPSEGDRTQKLVAMVTMPPDSNSVAWPLVLLAEHGKFQGYLMIKLDSSNYRSWAELSNTRDRRGTASGFDVRYALTASRNLAVAIHAIHTAGHCVGDVNESNIFVGTDASVFIVDTDSAQIVAKDGRVFPCMVGKPEYTAAELTHGSLKDQRRTIASDTFAYVVAMFQMLTGGAHPTDGIFTDEKNEPPSMVEKIRQSILPGLNPSSARHFRPVPRIPAQAIPSILHTPMVKALQADPTKRPSLETFISLLDDVLSRLVQCSQVPQHWFDSKDKRCAWCIHKDAGNLDPWSREVPKTKIPDQKKLPSVKFQDAESSIGPAPRALPNIPSQSPQRISSPNSSSSPKSAKRIPNMAGLSSPNPITPHIQPPVQKSSSSSHPKKIKGKMVLDYADGSWGVRPPYRVLLKHNPKLAFHCMAEETPSFARAWWHPARNIAIPWALGLGLLTAFMVSVSMIVVVPLIGQQFVLPYIQPMYQNLIFVFWGLIGAGTGALASMVLAISGLHDRAKTAKHTNLSHLKKEAPGKTVLSFVPIPIIYGPILLLVLSVMLVVGLLQFLLAIIKTSPR